MPDLLLAWLLTYLIHSTLLLGSVWLLTRLWRRLAASWAETLWRTALFGSILTASLQMGFAFEPMGGTVAMPATAVVKVRTESPLAPVVSREPAAEGTALSIPPTALGVSENAVGPQPEPIAPPSAAAPTSSATVTAPAPLPEIVAALWLLGMAVFLLRHERARRHLRARLAHRTRVGEGALRTSLDGLARTAGLSRAPTLTEVARLGSPLAIGVRHPEIVIPSRAEHDLTHAQQSAMLAHELAHHVRRDALWQAATRWMTGVLFFQPLNLLAARRLRDTAELLADAWAVDRTGCSRSLAECLTVVAGWRVRTPTLQPAPAMAAHGSMLEQRVERLVEHDLPPAASRGRRALRLLALVPLIVVVLAAPAVAIGAAGGSSRTAEMIHVRRPPTVAPTTAPAPTTLDAEIRLLEGEIAELLALLARVTNPPPALTAGVSRLTNRLTTLKTQRAALARAPTPEMPR